MCNLTHTVIQNFVTRIPIGKVMAYGEVAEKLCTEPRAGAKGGRVVANAMKDAKHKGLDVPWHRVLKKVDDHLAKPAPRAPPEQRSLLKKEGVKFDQKGRVSRREHGCCPCKGKSRR